MLQTLSDWLLYSDTFRKNKNLHHLNSTKHLIWIWEANSETFRPYQLIGLLTSSKTLRSCMQYWLSFQHFYFWTIIFSFLNHYFQLFEPLFSAFLFLNHHFFTWHYEYVPHQGAPIILTRSVWRSYMSHLHHFDKKVFFQYKSFR